MLNQRIQETIFRAPGSSLHLFPSPTHIDHYVLKPTEHFGEGVFLSSLHVYLLLSSYSFLLQPSSHPQTLWLPGVLPLSGKASEPQGLWSLQNFDCPNTMERLGNLGQFPSLL